ncbi:MAG: hypothetical protein R3330_20230 [Saprospiraceae bacterium]|nr:hypothetical protein [Saprospiraceae bacterium]
MKTRLDPLESYWFSFRKTTVNFIDEILKAVAFAGRYSHSTEGWNEPIGEGEASPVDMIQNATKVAAVMVHRLEDENRRLEWYATKGNHYKQILMRWVGGNPEARRIEIIYDGPKSGWRCAAYQFTNPPTQFPCEATATAATEQQCCELVADKLRLLDA